MLRLPYTTSDLICNHVHNIYMTHQVSTKFKNHISTKQTKKHSWWAKEEGLKGHWETLNILKLHSLWIWAYKFDLELVQTNWDLVVVITRGITVEAPSNCKPGEKVTLLSWEHMCKSKLQYRSTCKRLITNEKTLFPRSYIRKIDQMIVSCLYVISMDF